MSQHYLSRPALNGKGKYDILDEDIVGSLSLNPDEIDQLDSNSNKSENYDNNNNNNNNNNNTNYNDKIYKSNNNIKNKLTQFNNNITSSNNNIKPQSIYSAKNSTDTHSPIYPASATTQLPLSSSSTSSVPRFASVISPPSFTRQARDRRNFNSYSPGVRASSVPDSGFKRGRALARKSMNIRPDTSSCIVHTLFEPERRKSCMKSSSRSRTRKDSRSRSAAPSNIINEKSPSRPFEIDQKKTHDPISEDGENDSSPKVKSMLIPNNSSISNPLASNSYKSHSPISYSPKSSSTFLKQNQHPKDMSHSESFSSVSKSQTKSPFNSHFSLNNRRSSICSVFSNQFSDDFQNNQYYEDHHDDSSDSANYDKVYEEDAIEDDDDNENEYNGEEDDDDDIDIDGDEDVESLRGRPHSSKGIIETSISPSLRSTEKVVDFNTRVFFDNDSQQDLSKISSNSLLVPSQPPPFHRQNSDRVTSILDGHTTSGPVTLDDSDSDISDSIDQNSPHAMDYNSETGSTHSNLKSKKRSHTRKLSGSLSRRELSHLTVEVRNLSRRLSALRIHMRPRNIIIITKIYDDYPIKCTHELVSWLLSLDSSKYGDLNLYVQDIVLENEIFDLESIKKESKNLMRLKSWHTSMCTEDPLKFDLAITLGGDGTVLYTSWVFQRIVPPVLTFNLGSLGFLNKFSFNDYKSTILNLWEKGVRCSLRMRFECTIMKAIVSEEEKKDPSLYRSRNLDEEIASSGHIHAIVSENLDKASKRLKQGVIEENLQNENEENENFRYSPTTSPPSTHHATQVYSILNDVVVDRGPNATMSSTELFGDDVHLTSVEADGVVISTPTGSTAYSLSAGGSLVHPDIPAMLVSPICPHTLSFRPFIVPDSMILKLGVPFDSRTTAWCSFDGRERIKLSQGDYLVVSASRYPFPVVMNNQFQQDWFYSLSETLHWNESKKRKAFNTFMKNE